MASTSRAHVIKDLRAKWFAFALASAAAAGAALAPVGAGAAMPVLAFLSVAACTGLIFAWSRADAALRAAEEAAGRCALLAERLARLEEQAPAPAAPGRRPAEAAGKGQRPARDLADLKQTLRISPEPRAPRAALADPPLAAGSEPSLLPRGWALTEDGLRRQGLVIQALEADRIELHLQPIVSLPKGKIRFYEALARLRLPDDALLGPAEFLPLLEHLGHGLDFDRRILERAIAVARHLVSRGSEAIVGVNLSSRSVREPGFLRTVTRRLDAAPELLGKIVLEFPQETWRRLDAEQRMALLDLRDRGVPLSLDGAADLRFDAGALADLGLRFMKLPADLMLAAARQEDSRRAAPDFGVRDFASALRRQGIRLVAERVEREEAVPLLADLGVPLAQGFVFAAPRPVRAEVFERRPVSEASFQRRAG